MLQGRVMRPAPSMRPVTQPTFDTVATTSFTLVVADASSFLEESLDAIVARSCGAGPCAWLRLTPLDARRDHLLASVTGAVAAARASGDEAGLRDTLSQAWASSGGWAGVGRALGASLPCDAAFVVENSGVVTDAAPVTDLLAASAAVTGRRLRSVLVWPGRVPVCGRRAAGAVLGPRELSAREVQVGALAGEGGGLLPLDTFTRLVRLAGGGTVFLNDMLVAAEDGNADLVAEVVATSHRPRTAMARLTSLLLARRTPAVRESLATALALGYWHPDMARPRPDPPAHGLRPWLVPLDGGWFRLRPLWARPLGRALGAAGHRESPAAGRPGRSVPARGSPPPGRLGSTSPAPGAPRSEPRGQVVQAGRRSGVPQVEARLLGAFELAIDGRRVDRWRGQRGPAVLKYLLVHRDRPCTRDILMEVFWPDATPSQARNRLHVALSAVRQSLRDAIDQPVVEFRHGLYRLNPDIPIDSDVDEFDRWATAASRADAAGDYSEALAASERAVAAYRGDLLADTPYDDWAVLPREALRIRYLDILDRLTALYIEGGRVTECIATARLVLQQDACREDAHRLLMHCYARQGRTHQAFRQFDLCCDALRTMLDAPPSPATLQVYEALRQRAPRLGRPQA